MGALPKRKISRARRGDRRSHLRLVIPKLDHCPQCHSAKLAHHVCPVCGYYNGREVIQVKSAAGRKK